MWFSITVRWLFCNFVNNIRFPGTNGNFDVNTGKGPTERPPLMASSTYPISLAQIIGIITHHDNRYPTKFFQSRLQVRFHSRKLENIRCFHSECQEIEQCFVYWFLFCISMKTDTDKSRLLHKNHEFVIL